MAFFTADYLDFFKELAANNNKEWFDDNRKRYTKSVKEPFFAFTQHMIDRLGQDDPAVAGMSYKECVFRINLDIRFSKDKTPYKLNMSCCVNPGGRKNMQQAGAYFELGPEFFKIYGGAYMPSKEDLYRLRQKIQQEGNRFQAILDDAQFKQHYGALHGEQNKRIPKEFKESAEQQPLIANKQFYYFTKLPPETILRDDFEALLLEHYAAGWDMMTFLREAVTE